MPGPNHLTCHVQFKQSGLHLKFKPVSATDFAAKIASLPAGPPPPISTPPVEHNFATTVPLFNPDDSSQTLAFDRITHMLFFSDDANWWFYPPGFDTKEEAAMSMFTAIQRLNNGTGLRVTFVPPAITPPLAGIPIPYNLYMRTVVWAQGNTQKGHATIIIDPIFETGEIHQ